MGRCKFRYTTEYGETYNQPIWNENTRNNYFDRLNERQNCINRSLRHAPLFWEIEDLELEKNVAIYLAKKELPKNVQLHATNCYDSHNFLNRTSDGAKPSLTQTPARFIPPSQPVTGYEGSTQPFQPQLQAYPILTQPSPGYSGPTQTNSGYHYHDPVQRNQAHLTQRMTRYSGSALPMPGYSDYNYKYNQPILLSGNHGYIQPIQAHSGPIQPLQAKIPQPSGTGSSLQHETAQAYHTATYTEPLPAKSPAVPMSEPIAQLSKQTNNKEPYLSSNIQPKRQVAWSNGITTPSQAPEELTTEGKASLQKREAELTMFIRTNVSQKLTHSHKVPMIMNRSVKDTKKVHPPRPKGNYQTYVKQKIPLSLPKSVIGKSELSNDRFYHTTQVPINKFRPETIHTKSALSGSGIGNKYAKSKSKTKSYTNPNEVYKDWKKDTTYNPWITEYSGRFKAFVYD